MATEDFQTPPLEIRPPNQDEWRRASQRGMYPVWMIAALSLNIFPHPKEKAEFASFLKERDPQAAKAYLDRCILLDQNLDHHPRLIDLKHKRRQKGRFGEIISLQDACHFLHDRQLEGREPMVRALCPELFASPSTEAQGQMTASAVPDLAVETAPKVDLLHEMDRLPSGAVFLDEIKEKGARYKIYALGALTILLEEILSNPHANLAKYIKGDGNLNMSKVGDRLHEILKKRNVNTLGNGSHSGKALTHMITTASKQLGPRTHDGRTPVRGNNEKSAMIPPPAGQPNE